MCMQVVSVYVFFSKIKLVMNGEFFIILLPSRGSSPTMSEKSFGNLSLLCKLFKFLLFSFNWNTGNPLGIFFGLNLVFN